MNDVARSITAFLQELDTTNESLEETVPEDLADDRSPAQVENEEVFNKPVDYKKEVAKEKRLIESGLQEIQQIYRDFSKSHDVDLLDLVYGDTGFMASCYPEGLPDFDGDIIYSEKYWNEFITWLKETKGIDLTNTLDEYFERPLIASDQKLYGTDNAVVKCQKYDLVAHSEDEKPLDCKMEKAPLEKPLTEGATPDEVSEMTKLAKEIGIEKISDLQNFLDCEALVDETPLETLRRYRATLGPDFRLKENKNLSKNLNVEESMKFIPENMATSLHDFLVEDFAAFDFDEDTSKESIYADAKKLVESTENGKLLQNASSMLNRFASKLNSDLVAKGINDVDFRVMTGKGSKIGIFGEKKIVNKLMDALHSLKGKYITWGVEEPRDTGAVAGVLIDNISPAQVAVAEDLNDEKLEMSNSTSLDFPDINTIITNLQCEPDVSQLVVNGIKVGKKGLAGTDFDFNAEPVVEIILTNTIDAYDIDWDEDGDYDPFSGEYESGISYELDDYVEDFEGLVDSYVEDINKENIFVAEVLDTNVDVDDLYLDVNWDERGSWRSLDGEVVQTITLKITKK